jgi:hypothetical protein
VGVFYCFCSIYDRDVFVCIKFDKDIALDVCIPRTLSFSMKDVALMFVSQQHVCICVYICIHTGGGGIPRIAKTVHPVVVGVGRAE